MKIIDLINMRAEGKEMPKKIRIDHWCYNFEWVKHISNYYDENNDIDLMSCLSMDEEELNYEVKIIEEEVKPLTKQDVEALGYACGEIRKLFENGWNKSLENKPFKEDKKIEKISINDNGTIGFPNGQWTARNMDKAFAIKINEIIDYLMEKKQ